MPCPCDIHEGSDRRGAGGLEHLGRRELGTLRIVQPAQRVQRFHRGGKQRGLVGVHELDGQRLIGQLPAVRSVADAVRRTRAGIADPDRPTGSFLFLGPTGVGKTSVVAGLIRKMRDRRWTALKITQYGNEVCANHTGAAACFMPC